MIALISCSKTLNEVSVIAFTPPKLKEIFYGKKDFKNTSLILKSKNIL